jgi:hypothetical protein
VITKGLVEQITNPVEINNKIRASGGKALHQHACFWPEVDAVTKRTGGTAQLMFISHGCITLTHKACFVNSNSFWLKS